MSGAETMTSVGDRIPGVNPAAAASVATRTGLSRGNAFTGATAARRPPSGIVASTSRATTTAAVTAAVRRSPAMRLTTRARSDDHAVRDAGWGGDGGTGSGASSADRLVDPVAVPAGATERSSPASDGFGEARKRPGQNARWPRIASIAGTTVIATTRPTSTVTANPGPSSRNRPERATTRPATPAATVSPAVTTMGRYSRTAATVAAGLRPPARSLPCSPARKKML